MPPDQQPATSGGVTAARGSRPHVLLVADNATERLVLARHLDRLGTAATAVGDGEQALEAVRRGGLDAVLIDRGLPGVDRLEGARLIRRLPGGAELPIIVMTADTHQEHRRECLAAGADDYLTKPLE